MNQFVIGDIHGCLDKLEKLLTYWNPKKEELILWKERNMESRCFWSYCYSINPRESTR